MRRKLGLAALLVLGSIVLGASVFREELANAAEKIPMFVVANTAANPVPVTSHDTTKVLHADFVNSTGEYHETSTFNVLPYKTVAVTFYTSGFCAPVHFEVFMAVEGGPPVENELSLSNCEDTRRTYEMPGETLQISWVGGSPSGTTVGLTILGRHN